MPIRINLLAEHQAAEDEKRRDPVKRAVLASGLVIAAAVLWTCVLQARVFAANSTLNRIQSQWKSIEKGYDAAVVVQRKHLEADEKLAALRGMSTNRFLWGTTLNAFQQTLNNVDDVQVVRFKGDQAFTITEPAPSRTNGNTVVRGKPGTAAEKVTLIIEAMDNNTQPGSRITAFKDSIAALPFFQQNLAKTNGLRLTGRSAPQINQATGGQYVNFSLECNFPEKVR